MEAEIAQLVTGGATTVVGLMATDAWTQLRSRLAGLLGRGRDSAEVSAELEEIRVEVLGAGGDTGLVDDQTAEVRNRLRRVLREDPGAAAEFRSILLEFTRGTANITVYNNTISGGSHRGSVIQVGRFDGNYQAPPSDSAGH
ncbi:hypothetical protein ACFCX4_35110 [Kitasatospora sp. NPDC056327]|uniref:hypothetical protein n=1 Tax=Kitasatospora sp. NPDC056327 TaxID=3345785 RepID=UPI0035D865D5